MYRIVREAVHDCLVEDCYNIVHEAVNDCLVEDSYNVRRELQRQALAETAAFVLEQVPLPKAVNHRSELLDRCIQGAPATGLFLEFGVYTGYTIRDIARRVPGRQVYGFDSFEGLLESWIFDPPGMFGGVEQLPDVPGNVTLIKGWFQDTLPAFLAAHTDNIAFLHIDSDLYSSCRYVLETVADRLVPGTVISFDELYNYPGWRQGEYRAFTEWLTASGAQVEFLAYVSGRGRDWKTDGSSGEQVAVKIVSMRADGRQ